MHIVEVWPKFRFAITGKSVSPYLALTISKSAASCSAKDLSSHSLPMSIPLSPCKTPISPNQSAKATSCFGVKNSGMSSRNNIFPAKSAAESPGKFLSPVWPPNQQEVYIFFYKRFCAIEILPSKKPPAKMPLHLSRRLNPFRFPHQSRHLI